MVSSKTKKINKLDRVPYFSSASSMFNLLSTGNVDRGFKLGGSYNLVGESGAGKSLLVMEAATSLCRRPPMGLKPRVMYYDTEGSFDADFARTIGVDFSKLTYIGSERENSLDCECIEIKTATIESLNSYIESFCESIKHDECGLFIVDSLDGFVTKLDKEFGVQDFDRRAKLISDMFRRLTIPLMNSRVCLVVISQIRDNLNATFFGKKSVRSGGRALKFFASTEIWISVIKKHKKSDTIYKVDVKASCQKNKHAPSYREVLLEIYLGSGTEEIGSMLRFLESSFLPDHLRLTISGGYYDFINNNQFIKLGIDRKKYRFSELVTVIAKDMNAYNRLRKLVQIVWDFRETQLKNMYPVFDKFNVPVLEGVSGESDSSDGDEGSSGEDVRDDDIVKNGVKDKKSVRTKKSAIKKKAVKKRGVKE